MSTPTPGGLSVRYDSTDYGTRRWLVVRLGEREVYVEITGLPEVRPGAMGDIAAKAGVLVREVEKVHTAYAAETANK